MNLFEVQPKDVADLPAGPFTDVMNHLLQAESHRLGIHPTKVDTTLRITVPDDGVDAAVEAPSGLVGRWIPEGNSVWQYKSGGVRTFKEMGKEFNKPGVQEALAQGGTYCFVSGRDCSPPVVKNRRKWLDELLQNKGLTPDRGRFLDAAHIAQWVSEHPAVVLLPYFRRPIGNLMRWDNWHRSHPQSHITFQADELRVEIREGIVHVIQQGTPFHIRIQGPAGVGKTCLTLEGLRGDGIRERVVYASVPEDIPLELLAWARNQPAVSFILVVDECDDTQADRLQKHVATCGGRVLLLTIGTSLKPTFFSSVPEGLFTLDKLGDQEIQRIVLEILPSISASAVLSREAASFIQRMASGYVKLATVLTVALARDPGLMSASSLARAQDVDLVLRTLLPDETMRQAMKVIALLSRVGWDGELADEGKAVAEFIGLPWGQVQDVANQMVQQGLVAHAGRYRYVTPHLLAVWLAAEVWEARGETVLELLAKLPTDSSRRALLERLADLGDHERARLVVENLLGPQGFYRDVADLDNDFRSQVFEMLAQASPTSGLRALERLIRHLPRDQLVAFRSGRRHVIWALEKLAWLNETFLGAGRLLLALAEAENENVGNNATGVWVGLFGTHLGGTTVPALERHRLIEEAFDSPSVERRLLGVRAIKKVLTIREFRSVGAERHRGRLVPPEWRPSNLEESQAVRLSALALLDRALSDPESQVADEAREVLLEKARELSRLGLVDQAFERIRSLKTESEAERRSVRDALHYVLRFEGEYLTQAQRQRLTDFFDSLSGESYRDGLRRWVGHWSRADRWPLEAKGWDQMQANAAALADEAMAQPELLTTELDWLFSAEAQNAFHFFRRLGELDETFSWLPTMLERIHESTGTALLAAYLQGRAGAGEREWVEETLDTWTEQEPDLAEAVFEATWRGPASTRAANRLLALVNKGWLESRHLCMSAVGGWATGLPYDDFRAILSTLIQDEGPQATEAALAMLMYRLEVHPDEEDVLTDVICLLVKRWAGTWQRGTVELFWEDLSKRCLSRDPLGLAKVILDSFAAEEWVFTLSEPRGQILFEATKADPENVWEEVLGAT